MRHSIVIAYRNRHANLRALLECLNHCAQKEQAEIVLVDLFSTDDTPGVLDDYRNRLDIKHHRLGYAGTFHKTMALNYGLKRAQGEIVTIHDVDCLPAPDFLEQIDTFFRNPHNYHVKLARDVFLLGDRQTQRVRSETYEEYSKWLFKVTNVCKAATTYDGKILGNSQCSMHRHLFAKIGGYDEGFVGYGFEDYEFSLRAHNLLGDAAIYGSLWHLWHESESDWKNSDAIRQTTERFRALEALGFPQPR